MASTYCAISSTWELRARRRRLLPRCRLPMPDTTLLPPADSAEIFVPPVHTLSQAFDQWRAEHLRTSLAVRRCLDGPVAAAASGGGEEELRPLVAAAQGELWSYFQLKRAVLSGCAQAPCVPVTAQSSALLARQPQPSRSTSGWALKGNQQPAQAGLSP